MSLLRDLQKYAITKDFFEEFHRPFKDYSKKPMSNVSQKSQLLANAPFKVEKSKVNIQNDNSYNSLFWTFYAGNLWS